MSVFGRRVNFIWWGEWVGFSSWQYPSFDMQEGVPEKPSKFFTGYHFGLFEVRIWWKGW